MLTEKDGSALPVNDYPYMLGARVLTTLVLMPLTLLAVLVLPETYFMLITAFIMSVAAWEWARLSAVSTLVYQCAYVLVLLLALWGVLFLPETGLLSISLVFWLAMLLAISRLSHRASLPVWPTWLVAMLGVFNLACCWRALLVLHSTPKYLFFLLLIVWLNDISAYFSGRCWGSRPLAATISPKKTWEGLCLGLATTLLVAAIGLCAFEEWRRSYGRMLGVSLITIVASVTGDLFESWLKRNRGLKDSAQLLPGHGGLLDRLDSLIAAAPVMAGSLLWLGLLR